MTYTQQKDKLVIKFFKTNKLKKKKFERYKILKEQNKIIQYLLNVKNPYQIKARRDGYRNGIFGYK